MHLWWLTEDQIPLCFLPGSSSVETMFSGTDSTSLKRLFTASRRVPVMVLLSLSASFSCVRACLRTVMIGMTSDAEADEKLTSLVSSSNGARTAMVFSSSLHWFAVNVAGSWYSAVYALRGR